MNATNRLILRRIALAVLTLWLVSMVVFTLTSLLPGDAAEEALGQGATVATVNALRAQLGLDQPAYVRYFSWLTGLLSGDPGVSLANQLPVSELIARRLPNSLVLAGTTAAVSVPIALCIGLVAAIRRGTLLDRLLNVLTLSLVAMPEFLVATVAVLIFAVKLHWLSALSSPPDQPGLGVFVRAYALPVLTLGFVIIAQMARMTRAAIIEQLAQPYAEMALLKGASRSRIALRHALPNAVGPIANAIALSLSYLLGGAIIVETIFNYPGIASLMVDAVTTRDMPLLQACAMIFCTGYLLLVLVADIAAILSNPRLRHP
jgi:peptide/nickel transport system permease protein